MGRFAGPAVWSGPPFLGPYRRARSKPEHMGLALRVNPGSVQLDVALPPRAKLDAVRGAWPIAVISRRSNAIDATR